MMRRVVVAFVIAVLLFDVSYAGLLYGRIMKADGKPLANEKIKIENKETKTNAFGGYRIELKDGTRELSVIIDSTTYTTKEIRVFSPRTKQNWRVVEPTDSIAGSLRKVQ